MRKKPSLAPLGESELELLQLVWEAGPITVSEIHQQILLSRQVAYTTVMSGMRKLAKKGYLTFTQDGNAYVYSAARPPHEVKFSLLSGILNKVFKGSPVELVESLVKHEAISEANQFTPEAQIPKKKNQTYDTLLFPLPNCYPFYCCPYVPVTTSIDGSMLYEPNRCR